MTSGPANANFVIAYLVVLGHWCLVIETFPRRGFMKILVANLGSTSFKYRLFDMTDERQLARGGIERIGSSESPCFVEIGGQKQELKAAVPDHAVAVRKCLEQLTHPSTGCLKDAGEVSAI